MRLGFGVRSRRDHHVVGDRPVGDERLRPVETHSSPSRTARVAIAGHVGAGAGLGDGQGADQLAGDRRHQPPLALLLAAEPAHVVGPQILVGAEGGRDPGRPGTGELLDDHRVGDEIGPGAAVPLVELRAEQANPAGITEHVSVRPVALALPLLDVGRQGSLDELADPGAQRRVVLGEQAVARDGREPVPGGSLRRLRPRGVHRLGDDLPHHLVGPRADPKQPRVTPRPLDP